MSVACSQGLIVCGQNLFLPIIITTPREGGERGNQMKTGEIERGNAPRFIPQNIPHTDPTVHDRTDKERRKTQ